MIELNKTISLIGYGVSNKALFAHFSSMGLHPVIRCRDDAYVEGAKCIIGNDYLNTCEDIVFRSPAIRPWEIKGNGRILCEAQYALELMNCTKIGVSGSDGKTTTCHLIYEMLRQSGLDAHLGGNVGFPLIDVYPKTTKDSYVCAELSSFQLEGAEIGLDTAVITNVTPNHLDWHRSMDEYISAKRRILKNCRTCVLPVGIFEDEPPEKTVRFTLDTPPRCERLVHVENGCLCYCGERVIPCESVLLRGDFNLKNAQCAIGALWGVVPKEIMEQVLRTFSGVEHRMELVLQINGVSFVDSSVDSTPSRTASTLCAFQKEKTAVILGGYDKNLDYGILSGATEGVKLAVVMGENRQKILPCVKDSASRVVTVNNLKEAVSVCFAYCESGDTVLLSPASASFDAFKNYKERSFCFREIIRGLKNGQN